MRPRTPAHRVKHGTMNGYWWHKRAGEQPCSSCNAANAARSREVRKRRRQQKIVLQQILNNGQAIKHTLTNAEVDEIIRTLKEDLDL